ncbi:hypothetical protein O3V59_05230 [Brevibacillus thermoruber]|jgi:hypothetical protein|uniref:Uncharacterized protein n=1 Tax=Brevibacillus thermoruber TaxID=33942 RepID=A0A9X3TPR0_9BACL|nr:hypothetical protein [Brevibacillus thermoruber]MDA5107753.1 hypothetical protein [Brevibacillus thermoruber]
MIRNLPVFLLLISCLVVMTGCSGKLVSPSSESRPESVLPHENLTAVSILMYREGSEKAQPELISTISEESKRNQLVDGVNKGTKTNLVGTVNSLSVWIVEYGTNEVVTQRKYLMYAKTKEGDHYIKLFEMRPDFDLDSYKQKDAERLIALLGKTDWYKVEQPPY